MALLKIVFTAIGKAPVTLSGVTTDPLPLQLATLEPQTVHFVVTNTLGRDVLFPLLTAIASGPAAAKVTLEVVPATKLAIAPNASATVDVMVTPIEPILEGESLDISVTASEAS